MMNTYAILVSGLLSGAVNILAIEATGAEQQVDGETGAPTRKVSVYNHMLPEKNKWKITTKRGRKVNGCKGGPYSQWYATSTTSCRLPGGSYTVTCCDARTNQGWSGGHIKVFGTKLKLCNKFTFGAKKKCYTQNFRLAPLPTPRPTPRPTPGGKINNLARCLARIGDNIVRVLPKVYKFAHKNDGIVGYAISDGGNDMYDTGNRLHIRYHTQSKYAVNLKYTQAQGGCSGSWRNTPSPGGDIKYFTCTRKTSRGDVFLAGFKSASKRITGFFTDGSTGADNVEGSWLNTKGPYKVKKGNLWCFTKSLGAKTGHGQDPSVNHLICVPKRNWRHYWPGNPHNGYKDIRRRRAVTTDPDYDKLEGSGVGSLFYVAFGGWNGKGSRPTAYRYSDQQMIKATNSINCR